MGDGHWAGGEEGATRLKGIKAECQDLGAIKWVIGLRSRFLGKTAIITHSAA